MSQPWTHSTPNSKAYERLDEHYVEPFWCSARLFDKEKFKGAIYDPCCGFGRILASAGDAGLLNSGCDLVDRRGDDGPTEDFLDHTRRHDNIVCNPPFDILEEFAKHAIKLAHNKVAMIMPTARLNAAHWLMATPLRRIWLLTPRPSMPPGRVILNGGKASGGKSDFCWLVWDKQLASVNPEVRWLHRDVEHSDDGQ